MELGRASTTSSYTPSQFRAETWPMLNNDAFYYGVLPPLAATAQAYGFTNLQIGFAALMGQAFHFLSPLVPFIYLLMDKTEITLAQYQGYIFKWCIGIFVIFMAMGFVTGSLAIL